MFPSLVQNPLNYHFDGQDPDESIILVVRAHPITNLAWLIPAILIFFLPFVIGPFSRYLGYDIFAKLPDLYLLSFVVINYLLVLVIVFEGFLNWYFNVNIVTNEKIMDVDFDSILAKNIDYALLEELQEITPRVAGVFGMIFDYGSISIQTAGSKVDLDFRNIPNPDKVADIILDLEDSKEGK